MNELEKYRELEQRLIKVRKKNNNQDCPEEDEVLDAMDPLWDKMTDSERQRVDPTWGQLHYLTEVLRADEELKHSIDPVDRKTNAIVRMGPAEMRVWLNMGRGKWIRHLRGIVCPHCGYKILDFKGPRPPVRCIQCMTDVMPEII